MEHRFHREAILTGCVDSYCLACEEYLKCERDAATHISKPVHRNNLLAVPYMDKYCDDHIRKLKKGYFCEFCNLLLPTAAKVGLHIAETQHVDNKATKLLKRIGNTVIAVGNVSISERAWHGLMEDTCAICNVEYDNEDIHKNQPTHILRLIQCKIQYGANNSIYRLIDNDTFQCLTCNLVLPIKVITEHLNNSDHKKLHSECFVSANNEKVNDPPINHQINTQDQGSIDKRYDLAKRCNTDTKIVKNKTETKQIELAGDENKKKILNSVNKIQRSDINIDFERESAYCKKCLTALDFNYDLIEQHMQEHVRKPMKTADSALYYPTADQKHNKTRLTLCGESTSGRKTSNNSEKSRTKQTKSFEYFLQENDFIFKIGEEYWIINKEILITNDSFTLTTPHGSTVHCHLCKVNFTIYDDHLLSLSHNEKQKETLVITSLDTEFVREIASGYYHCGYCHKFFHDWNSLLEHLQCPEHTSVKLRAKSHLDEALRKMNKPEEIDNYIMVSKLWSAGVRFF